MAIYLYYIITQNLTSSQAHSNKEVYTNTACRPLPHLLLQVWYRALYATSYYASVGMHQVQQYHHRESSYRYCL